MSVRIVDGWLVGELVDDKGREWPIRRFDQTNQGQGPIALTVPNLVLHTTETDGYVEHLAFPSQFQCGEGIIGQHIRLGMSGDALREWDRHARDIELVGWSKLFKWLPQESTLGPAVALVAWLHKNNKIKTGLRRPTDWPLLLDRLPAATTTYYRRHAGLWASSPGVYGHVEIPGNTHWDPGSFDYPTFFERVEAAIRGGEEDMRLDEFMEGAEDFRIAYKTQGGDPGPPPEGKSRAYNQGWAGQRFGADKPAPAEHDHDHNHDGRYAKQQHPHTIS